MRFIYNPCTDASFNLAAEEWLLRNSETDIFMLWRNAASVIVGRNQNSHSEINADYVQQHGIPVVRRLTGGGAVFHDLGNINFTFISLNNHSGLLDFKRFAAPITEALNALGVPCEFNGRNDMVVGESKISGNARTCTATVCCTTAPCCILPTWILSVPRSSPAPQNTLINQSKACVVVWAILWIFCPNPCPLRNS